MERKLISGEKAARRVLNPQKSYYIHITKGNHSLWIALLKKNSIASRALDKEDDPK